MAEHPRNYINLNYRSKRRTMNLAFAPVGRSTGWGDGKPRRWFIGHHRGWSYHRGFRLEWMSDPTRHGMSDRHRLAGFEWGASPKPRTLTPASAALDGAPEGGE